MPPGHVTGVKHHSNQSLAKCAHAQNRKTGKARE